MTTIKGSQTDKHVIRITERLLYGRKLKYVSFSEKMNKRRYPIKIRYKANVEGDK